MSKSNDQIRSTGVSLLIVEGGDERSLCERVAGPALWARIHCWKADGQSKLADTAALAARDPNIASVKSIGVVFDMEESAAAAQILKTQVEAKLLPLGKPVSWFIMPANDGVTLGSIETLCRTAVKNPTLAACVNALEQCAGGPGTTQARRDKAWLNAYFAMQPDPMRFHEGIASPAAFDAGHAVFDPLRAFLAAL